MFEHLTLDISELNVDKAVDDDSLKYNVQFNYIIIIFRDTPRSGRTPHCTNQLLRKWRNAVERDGNYVGKCKNGNELLFRRH